MEIGKIRTDKEKDQDEIVSDVVTNIAEILALKESLKERRKAISSAIFGIATLKPDMKIGDRLSAINVNVAKGAIKGAYLQRDAQGCQKRCSLMRILDAVGVDDIDGYDLVEELIDSGELERCENRCNFSAEFNNQSRS